MNSLSGKKILVTGGSRGIGAAIVKELAAEGAQIFFTYSSNESAATEVLNSLPGSGHKIGKLNLSNDSSIEELVKEVNSWGPDLTGLVNNAGITKDGLFMRMKTEDFDSVMGANLRGVFLLTKGLIRNFIKNRSGSIVNVSSVVGSMGSPGQTNYAASKSGLEGFSRSLAMEIAERNVRVNSIAPGFIDTEMTAILTEDQKAKILTKIPMARLAAPSEVAKVVRFLISDDASYITGQVIHVNGGMYLS